MGAGSAGSGGSAGPLTSNPKSPPPEASAPIVSASALPAPASEKASAAATALVIFTDVRTVDLDNKMSPLSVVVFGATPLWHGSKIGRRAHVAKLSGLTSGDGRPGRGWCKAQVEGAVPYHPDVAEPGLWLQFDWGAGPTVDGRARSCCAWLGWSRFRVVLAGWSERASPAELRSGNVSAVRRTSQRRRLDGASRCQ